MLESEMAELAKAIGDEIAYWRRRRNLSREQFAKVLGMSGNTIGRYERGDTMPDVTQTWTIAEGLGLTPTFFVSRVETTLAIWKEQRDIADYEPSPEDLAELDALPEPSEEEIEAAGDRYMDELRERRRESSRLDASRGQAMAAKRGDIEPPEQS